MLPRLPTRADGKSRRRLGRPVQRAEWFFIQRYGFILFGICASLSYGLWGFLEKLATQQSPVATNLLVYGVAFAISTIGLYQWRPPSIAAILAGICGGGINALVLYALQRHQLTLVYPFISFGTLFFVALSFFFLGGRLLVKSWSLLALGSFVALGGIAICGIGLSGGFAGIDWGSLDAVSISIGLMISVLTGLWIFLAFVTVAEQEYKPLIATTWVFLGSLLVAAILAAADPVSRADFHSSQSVFFAVAAGLFMFLGEYSTYCAFRSTPSSDSRLEQGISALLANSELVPIVILSAVILGDRTIEGILGCALVLAGIAILNHARA